MSSQLQPYLIPIKASLCHDIYETKGCVMRNKPRKFFRKDSKDITGIRFGRLMAVSPVQIKGERGLRWKCICDCGNERIVHGGHLRAGTTKSCGCRALDRLDESAKSALYGRYLARARKRKIDFLLTREQFDSLILKNCFYCDSPPNQKLKNSTNRQTGFYNGVDRFDNEKHYTEDNCFPCCKACNIMKYDMTYDNFISHIKLIIRRHGDKSTDPLFN